MKSANAYWLSPFNYIQKVETSHIAYVIVHAKEFDLTIDYIKKKYVEHNEKFGFEGKARQEILLELIKNGWVRARYNESRTAYGWTFELWELDQVMKERISKWANEALKLEDETKFGVNTSIKIKILNKSVDTPEIIMMSIAEASAIGF